MEQAWPKLLQMMSPASAGPAENATGVSNISISIDPKRLEILRELVPSADKIACLRNPQNANADTQLREVQAAAHTLGQKIFVVGASTDREFDGAFARRRSRASRRAPRHERSVL